METKKIQQYIDKNVKWSKSAQGGWKGRVQFPSGFAITVVAAPDMKMREAKSFVKETLLRQTIETAEEKQISLM